MQIQITMSYHLTPVRMGIIKHLQKNDAGEVVKQTLLHYYGNVNLSKHHGQQNGGFLKH